MTNTEFFDAPLRGKDRNFVTALARGLEVLRCFRPNEIELTNAEFAERTGLAKATISRLTHTLCELDYLVVDPRTGTYRLSAGVLQLGFGVLSGLDIGDRAEKEMRALRNGPNSYVTVALAEQHRLDVVYVAVQRSREEVALTMRIGSRLPLFFSAIGRAILVGMDEAERQEVFAYAKSVEPDGQSARVAGFERARHEYNTVGFCSSYGEWRADVNGIAVPVKSFIGGRFYGMNVGGPSFHVRKKQLETVYAKRLFEAARTLSMQTLSDVK
jgi:DNA-binding IclR family transcriptional regulator